MASQLRQRHSSSPNHSRSTRERCPLRGCGTNCRRGGCASAASHLYTSCKGGIYGVLWAHARGPVRSLGVRRCGASLACLCARLSASRGSETPACEASPAALVRHMVWCECPRPHGGVPPLAASPTRAVSRAAARRGRRGPAPPPWCPVRRQLWRTVRCVCARPPPTAAGRCMACAVRGSRGVRCEHCARAPPWPLRGPCRAPLRGGARSSATSALCRKGRGGILVTERSPPFFKELQTSTTTLLVWVGARDPSRGHPPPLARLEGAPPPQTPMAARDETDPNREAVGSAWRSSERSSVSLADAHLRLTACTTSVQRRGCLFFFVALVL